MDDNSDINQDAAFLDPIVTALKMLVDKVEELEEKLQKVETTLFDELIGGIEKLYTTNTRNMGIDGLKSKYGEMFGDIPDRLKEFSGEDLYDKLYDLIDQIKGQEGDGFDEAGKVNEIFGTLKGKFDKLSGEKPGGLVVEAVNAAPVEKTEAEKLIEEVKSLKTKNQPLLRGK